MVEEKVRNFLNRIENYSHLNAFLEVFYEESLKKAQELDYRLKNNLKVGQLAGLVLAVKDNIAIKGKNLTCGSKILQNFKSLYNATVIDKLLAEDAIIIGKTNLDEFAMGSSNENSAFGPVHNPKDITRVPGGSSGGSAAAVAADLCDAALGSDTGGSIRQPAAFCGVFGLKPTYGRVSRFGLVAFASSFDTIGPIAKSTKDIAKILSVISGFDEKDSTSVEIELQNFEASLDNLNQNIKFGFDPKFLSNGVDSEIVKKIEEVITFFIQKGFEVKEISLPHMKYSIANYYVLTTAEASSNLSRYDGVKYGKRSEKHTNIDEMYKLTRDEFLGTEVKRRIMLGTYVLSAGYYDAYYLQAQKVRRLIQEDFINAFEHVDLIISPTTPTTAFKIGEKSSDPLEMYLSDIFTTSANLAGIPAISIPIGYDSKNLPIALQLMSSHFNEELLLQVSFLIENSFN